MFLSRSPCINVGDSVVSRQMLRAAVSSVCADIEKVHTISQQSNRRVVRYQSEGGLTVVIKVWERALVRGIVRIVSYTSPTRREYVALQHLYRSGVSVPRVIDRFVTSERSGVVREAVVMEDLGECSNGVDYLKQCLQHSESDALSRFDEQILEITGQFVRIGLIDYDHGLVNFLVTPADRRVVRIDCEHACRIRSPLRYRRNYARMIASLVASYVYAVQPRVELAESFANRLTGLLCPAEAVLRDSYCRIQSALERQYRKAGIDSRINLPW